MIDERRFLVELLLAGCAQRLPSFSPIMRLVPELEESWSICDPRAVSAICEALGVEKQ